MQQTARLKIPYPDLNGDDTPVDIPQVWFNRAVILDGLAPITEGPLSGRPVSTSGSPGVEGRFYITTDQSPGGGLPVADRLDLDTGAGWITIGPFPVDGPPAVGSLRTLGTGPDQAVAGDDARLIGGAAAGGDLGGTYPDPTVNTWNGQTKSQVVASNTPQAHAGSHAPGGADPVSGLTDASVAVANKDGAANLPSLRTLGGGALQAMPGNATPTPGAHAASHKYTGSDPLALLKPTPQNTNYAAVVGDLVLMTGSNNTVTLPNAPSVDGAQCAVMAITAGVTVNRAGTDTITTSAQGQLTVTVAQGTTVVFTYHSGAWYGIVSGAGGGASGLVALNPPSRAYRATTVSLANGVATKIPFDTSSFDPIGAFDLTTNHRYNVQTAGYYLIEGGVQLTGLSAGSGISVMIYKNGAEISDGNYAPGLGYEVTDVIQCSAGDYIEIFVWNGSGATLNTVANKPAGTYLTVSQIAQIGSPPAGQGLQTAARAHVGAAQTLIANAWTTLNLDTKDFDPGSCFDTANHQYVCPATGYYQVSGQIGFNNPSAQSAAVHVLKNGNEVSVGIYESAPTGGNTEYTLVVNDVLYCQAGDRIQLAGYVGSANAPLQWVQPSYNYMSVVQVAGSSVFGALSPTAQNAPYAAGAGQLVLMTGANAVTLPNAPTPGSQVEVLALTAAVPVNRAGADTINNSGVSGLSSLTVQAGQSIIFSYLGGVWYASPVGGGQSLAPPARAYRNAAFNITNAAVKIPLDTKSYDPGGNLDVTTNNRYIAPVSGYYRVDWSVTSSGQAAQNFLATSIYKNGALVSQGSIATQNSGFAYNQSVGSDVVQLNAGDYIELWASATATIAAQPGPANVFMAVNQVGVPIGAPSPGQGLSTAAKAHSGANTNVPANTYTPIPVSVVDFDPGNNISTTRGGYVCPTTGYYQFNGQMGYSVAQTNATAYLLKNGVATSTGLQGATSSSVVISDIIFCQAGDFLELQAWAGATCTAGGTLSVTQVAGTNLIGALSPTAQSANYAAGAGQLVLATGAITVTLPNAPMNGSQVGVKALTGTVTVSRSGTDLIAGGEGGQSGIASFTIPNAATAMLVYFNGTWYLTADYVTSITVTVLPANPVDGQECFYLADGPNGIVWHLRYRAASASTHKWEFVGGSEMFVDNQAYSQTITANGGFVAAPGAPGTITVPVIGDYEIEFGGDLLNNSAGNNVEASMAVGANGVMTGRGAYAPPTTILGQGTTVSRKFVSTGRAAGDVLSFMVQTNNLNGTLTAPFMYVRPLRVG